MDKLTCVFCKIQFDISELHVTQVKTYTVQKYNCMFFPRTLNEHKKKLGKRVELVLSCLFCVYLATLSLVGIGCK